MPRGLRMLKVFPTTHGAETRWNGANIGTKTIGFSGNGSNEPFGLNALPTFQNLIWINSFHLNHITGFSIL